MSVLLRYQGELEQPLIDASMELLKGGQASQLCTLFEVFDLDLSFFLTTMWRKAAQAVRRSPSPTQHVHPPLMPLLDGQEQHQQAGGSPSPQREREGTLLSSSVSKDSIDASTGLNLRAVFDALHVEFGLPRCASGEVQVRGGAVACQASSALETSSPGADDELRFLLSNPLKLFTATQEHLLVVRSTFDSLTSLLKLFTFHGCVEYVLVLSTILVQPDAIKRVIGDRGDLEQQWVEVLMAPENLGYRRLLRTVIPGTKGTM
jgi:hypothetical protein